MSLEDKLEVVGPQAARSPQLPRRSIPSLNGSRAAPFLLPAP